METDQLNLGIKSFYLRVSFEISPAKEASNESNLCCSDRTSYEPCDIGAAPEYFGSQLAGVASSGHRWQEGFGRTVNRSDPGGQCRRSACVAAEGSERQRQR